MKSLGLPTKPEFNLMRNGLNYCGLSTTQTALVFVRVDSIAHLAELFLRLTEASLTERFSLKYSLRYLEVSSSGTS